MRFQELKYAFRIAFLGTFWNKNHRAYIRVCVNKILRKPETYLPLINTKRVETLLHLILTLFLPWNYRQKRFRLHLSSRIHSQCYAPEHVVMRSSWMRKAYGTVFPQVVTFHVEFCADFSPVRSLPAQERIKELLVHHTLLKKACHFAFAGHAEVYAFCVVDACVLHV